MPATESAAQAALRRSTEPMDFWPRLKDEILKLDADNVAKMKQGVTYEVYCACVGRSKAYKAIVDAADDILSPPAPPAEEPEGFDV